MMIFSRSKTTTYSYIRIVTFLLPKYLIIIPQSRCQKYLLPNLNNTIVTFDGQYLQLRVWRKFLIFVWSSHLVLSRTPHRQALRLRNIFIASYNVIYSFIHIGTCPREIYVFCTWLSVFLVILNYEFWRSTEISVFES